MESCNMRDGVKTLNLLLIDEKQLSSFDQSLQAVYHNKIMFQELVNALGSRASGKAVDILRNIPHFRMLEDQFGAEYLSLMIPAVTPFILRAGLALLEERDQYVLMQGDLEGRQPQFLVSRPLPAGIMIDLKERRGQECVAASDCKMVRIARQGRSALQKRLAERERQCQRQLRENQRLLGLLSFDQRQMFVKIPFFQCLGDFDMNTLATHSNVEEYSLGSITHLAGLEVEKIGCVLQGRVRLSFAQERPAQRNRDSNVQWMLGEGDWIGLEQYLQSGKLGNSGNAVSATVRVGWIPRDLFATLFSSKLHPQALDRLSGLVATRRMLLERSFQCMRNHHNANDINPQPIDQILAKKIAALDPNRRKRKGSFHRVARKEHEMPESITHRFYYEQAESGPLPPLKDKVMLFPEEFAASPVSATLQKQLQRLQDTKQPRRNRAQSLQRTIDSPEALYKTIYQRIVPQLKRRDQRPFKTKQQKQIALHSNCSIYNNFRASRHQQCLQNRTLTIISDSKRQA